MNESIMENVKESKFGINKYFLAIIKGFLEKYMNENSRINMIDSQMMVKAGDKLGSREITFSLKEDSLIVIVDRNIDFRKYQDIIEYDSEGIMMKRKSISSLMKKNVNNLLIDKPSILIEEFENFGNSTLNTGKIFDVMDIKTIERPSNYGLDGFYTHKRVAYDDKGMMKGNYIEGKFNVLKSNSLSNLEYPNENDIEIIKQEILDDSITDYTYPSSRTL